MVNTKPKKIAFDYNKLHYVLAEKGIHDEEAWYARVCDRSGSNYKLVKKGMIVRSDLVKIAKDLNIHIGWLRNHPHIHTSQSRPVTGDYVIDVNGDVVPAYVEKTLSNPIVAAEVFAEYNEDYKRFKYWYEYSNILDFANGVNEDKGLPPITKEEFEELMYTRIFEMHDEARRYLGKYFSDNIQTWRAVREYMKTQEMKDEKKTD